MHRKFSGRTSKMVKENLTLLSLEDIYMHDQFYQAFQGK